MPARLTLHYSDQPARTFTAEDGREYLLGRGPECDLVVDDARVSRRHARLSATGERLSIVDLGSKNGIEVDGLAVESHELDGPCWLSLGGLLVQVESGRDALDDASAGRRRAATLHEHLALAEQGVGVGDLVGRLLRSYLQISGTERGFVLLAGRSGRFEVVASTGLSADAIGSEPFSGSVSTVESVLTGGRPLIRSDASADAQTGARPSIVREEIRALVCVPLLAAGRTLGAVYGDSRRPGTSFRDLDVEILEELARHAALAMWAAGLKEELEGLAGALPTRVNPAPSTPVSLPGFPTWKPSSTADPEEELA